MLYQIPAAVEDDRDLLTPRLGDDPDQTMAMQGTGRAVVSVTYGNILTQLVFCCRTPSLLQRCEMICEVDRRDFGLSGGAVKDHDVEGHPQSKIDRNRYLMSARL